MFKESEHLVIQSHQGPYPVTFHRDLSFLCQFPKNSFFVVDEKVASLYKDELREILKQPHLLIEAKEENKALEKTADYVEKLVLAGLQRGHQLVAIGGGITQDLTCFLASIFARGLPWSFVPTTLLAQADSCIGSKSSINVGPYKNLVGNFYPPKNIELCPLFLKTLDPTEIHSGIGEMLKVHIIDGLESFREIAKEISNLPKLGPAFAAALLRSLQIKKRIIEIDEFDKKERLVMNYGHTYGHAIETATQYKIPHGIAVTIGMDMANHYAMTSKKINHEQWFELHSALKKNMLGFDQIEIPLEPFMKAISRDKKNVGAQLALILPKPNLGVEKILVNADAFFRETTLAYFGER